MEYFPTDKPGYRHCDNVVWLLQSLVDNALINKRKKTDLSILHFTWLYSVLYKLGICEFGFGLQICEAEVSSSFTKVCIFSFVCVHGTFMSIPAYAARHCQQGQRLVNKYYRSTCFDEEATGWGVNSNPRPFFKQQFTDHGGWDIYSPILSKKYVNPLRQTGIYKNKRKCALVFVGIKCVGGN